MILFKKTTFIISLIIILKQSLSLEENKYSIPRSMALRGYLGTYRQNLSGCPTEVDEEDFLNDMTDHLVNPLTFDEKTFQFITFPLEPFVFSFITETYENGEDSFVVWGPMYSLLHVAVQRLNYR